MKDKINLEVFYFQMEEETRLLVERFEQPSNESSQDLGRCQYQIAVILNLFSYVYELSYC